MFRGLRWYRSWTNNKYHLHCCKAPTNEGWKHLPTSPDSHSRTFSSRFHYPRTMAQISEIQFLSWLKSLFDIMAKKKKKYNKNNALKTSFIFRATGLHLLSLLNSMQHGRDESLLYLPKQNSKLRTVNLFVRKILKWNQKAIVVVVCPFALI